MPRNSSGTMSGANGPYVSGTTISSVAINARFADDEAETTDSLSRSGKGGMLAVLRGVDGTVAAPAYSYTAETGTGWYRAAAADLRAALAGIDTLTITAFGLFHSAVRYFLSSTATNSTVQVRGKRDAADTGADVELNGQVTRTAGLLTQVMNNGVGKTDFDYQGLVRLTTQAGPIQPAALWTAITPDTNIAASRGLGYIKDAVGKVHFRGLITNNTGGNITTVNASNPLPATFRPTSRRDFICSSGNAAVGVDVSTGGLVEFFVAFPAGGSVSLDNISFFPEQ